MSSQHSCPGLITGQAFFGSSLNTVESLQEKRSPERFMFLQDHESGAPGEGCRWSADLDLEKFSDRVHHDRLVERIGDTALLTSGVLEGGLVLPTNVSPAIGYLILKHHQATIGQISESFIPNRTARAYVESKQL